MLMNRGVEQAVTPRQARRSDVVDCLDSEVDDVVRERYQRGMVLKSEVVRTSRRGQPFITLMFVADAPTIEYRG